MAVVSKLSQIIESPIYRIADLAAGTGAMAKALASQWPDAQIYCEEPSTAMIAILKMNMPYTQILKTDLQNTEITDQDLVTIAFNSINYVQPNELNKVFQRIRMGMKDSSILYFDALTVENAKLLLENRTSIEKTTQRPNIEVIQKLTHNTLSHKFLQNGSIIEEHIQYLVELQDYLSVLSESGFHIIETNNKNRSLRCELYCKAI